MKSNTIVIAVFAALLGAAAPLAAQVGHPPEASPYRPVRGRQMLAFTGGYLGGDLGAAGVGPSNGPIGGVRLDLPIGGPGAVHFDLGYAELERRLVDPEAALPGRVLGTARQSILLLDGGLTFTLTGRKTWNHVAPYVGAAAGLVLGGSVDADSLSGFRFDTKFIAAPLAGLRVHVGDRVTLRIEGRDLLWRLTYPLSFFAAPENDPDAPPILDPETTKRSEWTHHGTLLISLGWSLGF